MLAHELRTLVTLGLMVVLRMLLLLVEGSNLIRAALPIRGGTNDGEVGALRGQGGVRLLSVEVLH